MESAVKTRKIRIGGMTCISCQKKIERQLGNEAGIENAEVSYSTGIAVITFHEEVISYQSIVQIIESLGYQVLTEEEERKPDTSRVIGSLLIIGFLYVLIQQFGLLNFLAPSQLAEATMDYGMLFVIGLVTSVHCVAMCGGINLSQCIPGREDTALKKSRFSTFRPTVLYNLGRVISYTGVGFLVGALGSVVTFSNTLQGVLKLAAGVFMVIMGINMLGIFPWLRRVNPRLPRIFAKQIHKEKSKSGRPLIVGLLNGLMPCGPLQAMQIYALSTGNPFSGALSMFLFSLGTVPLMFGLGALSSVLGKRFANKVMTVGAVLVVVLGMSMFSQGANLSGFQVPDLFSNEKNSSLVSGEQEKKTDAKTEDGVQIINSTLTPGKYPTINVQRGIPVKWMIDAPKGSINGCNSRMLIRDLGIEYSFQTGENVIEFTPEKTGKISYSCWMGMIRGAIYVTEEGDAKNSTGAEEEGVLKQYAPKEPTAAGYRIPTDQIAVGEAATDEYGNSIQRINIELTDDGFKPAAAVIKSGVDVEWNILDNTFSSTYGTELLVPDFATRMPLEKGENNLYFTPAGSFDFSTGDHAFYGYMKVVDDLNNLDMDGIKKEISSFKTLIWPEETFQGADGSCCG